MELAHYRGKKSTVMKNMYIKLNITHILYE